MKKQKIVFELDEELDSKIEDDIKEILEDEGAENINVGWEEDNF